MTYGNDQGLGVFELSISLASLQGDIIALAQLLCSEWWGETMKRTPWAAWMLTRSRETESQLAYCLTMRWDLLVLRPLFPFRWMGKIGLPLAKFQHSWFKELCIKSSLYFHNPHSFSGMSSVTMATPWISQCSELGSQETQTRQHSPDDNDPPYLFIYFFSSSTGCIAWHRGGAQQMFTKCMHKWMNGQNGFLFGGGNNMLLKNFFDFSGSTGSNVGKTVNKVGRRT